MLAADLDMARAGEVDAIVICVPTPLSANREPDLRIVTAVTEEIALHLREGQLVILESTTFPGTTREVLQPILERSGWVAGQDFHLAMSPERIDPGRTDHAFSTTPKVVGGMTPGCVHHSR